MASGEVEVKSIKRSTDTVKMVREIKLKDGTVDVIIADLPAGRGWNQGHGGAIDWINMGVGWRSYDEWVAEKHQKEVAEKKAAKDKGEK